MSRSAPNDAVLPGPRPPPAKPRSDLDALFALTKRFCCVQIGNCVILLVAVPASIYCMLLSIGILAGFLGFIRFVEVQCAEERTGEARHLRKALAAADASVAPLRGHDPGPRGVALHGAGLGLRAGHDGVDHFRALPTATWIKAGDSVVDRGCCKCVLPGARPLHGHGPAHRGAAGGGRHRLRGTVGADLGGATRASPGRGRARAQRLEPHGQKD